MESCAIGVFRSGERGEFAGNRLGSKKFSPSATSRRRQALVASAALAPSCTRQSTHALEGALYRRPARIRALRRLAIDRDRRWLPLLLHLWLGVPRNRRNMGLWPQPPRTDYYGLGQSQRVSVVSSRSYAADLRDRHAGRGRRRGGVHDLRARGRHLGQLDSYRSDRPRDCVRQAASARCDEAACLAR